MDGKIKPKRAGLIIYGNIIINIHPNQVWESIKRRENEYCVRHKIISMTMSKEEFDEYFEKK